MTEPADTSAGPAILDVTACGEDRFVAEHGPLESGRMFGGLVVAQALRAAACTVDASHQPHSLHAYFARGGRAGGSYEYRVRRIRDGRSFTTRQVDAVQDGEIIVSALCSFHRAGEGRYEYQLPAPPIPPRAGVRFAAVPLFADFEILDVGPTERDPDGTWRSTRRLWMRTAELPDDPVVHCCALTVASDMGVVLGAQPLGDIAELPPNVSIDHALWFHRRFRADQWLFYDVQLLTNHNARGLIRGTVHTPDGVLVASATQEALTP